MKLITFLYIFVLYILLVPGFLFKKHKYIHSLLYALCLYFTLFIVNNTRENYSSEHSFKMNGLINLGDLLANNIKENTQTVFVNNKVRDIPKKENDNNDDLIISAYKKIDELKKENTILNQSLAGYKGDESKIDELNGQLSEYKNKITALKTQLDSYNGTDASVDKLNLLINKLQSDTTLLKLQLSNCENKTK